MNLRLGAIATAVLVAVGMTAGCSDGDSDGGSSVSGSKQLLELTAEENRDLCKFYERSYKNSLGSEVEYCTANALFGAQSVEACEANRDQCVESGEYDEYAEEDWACKSAGVGYFVSEGDECTATVAELEACIKEDGKQWNDLTKYTCDEAEQAEYPWAPDPLVRSWTKNVLAWRSDR